MIREVMRPVKYVILSADNERKVYLVSDFIAGSQKDFNKLCLDFDRNWKDRLICPKDWFDEKDFVEYLNETVCQEEKCVFVESLGWNDKRKNWPEKYRKCYRYDF